MGADEASPLAVTAEGARGLAIGREWLGVWIGIEPRVKPGWSNRGCSRRKAQGLEDPSDGGRGVDDGEDPEPGVAGGTVEDVDREGAPKQIGRALLGCGTGKGAALASSGHSACPRVVSPVS